MEIFQMSRKEIERYYIIQKMLYKEIKQKKAAEFLKLSTRQIRYLLTKLKCEGIDAITSKKQGRPSNRAYSYALKKQVMWLIKERYTDFGPTFAKEKLEELHGIKICYEILRMWMIEEKLWFPRMSKRRLTRPRANSLGN